MRKVQVTIPAVLPSLSGEEAIQIDRHMFRFGNARRRAYSMQNKGVPRSRGVKVLQEDTGLNSRYVNDAWNEVEKLPELVTFGGKENQELLEKGEISREEWHQRRNSILISRGDKSKNGNLNLRIVERDGKLKLRINIGDRKWIYPDLFIPKKYLERFRHLLDGSKPYQVLVKRKGEKCEVRITVGIDREIRKGGKVLSIDLNSGFLDYSIVDKRTKRLIKTERVNFHKILDSPNGKSEDILYKVVNKLGNIAKHYNAEVLIGKFNTGDFKSPSSRATRRIKGMSQYRFRQILKYKLALRGIRVVERSEAHTSQVGRFIGRILGVDEHKGSSYAFALKVLDYQGFKLLRSVLPNDGDGSPGQRLSDGNGLTALVQSYTSGDGGLSGLGNDDPILGEVTPRFLVGTVQPESETTFTSRCQGMLRSEYQEERQRD